MSCSYIIALNYDLVVAGEELQEQKTLKGPYIKK
jgi:hypothetical protein